LPTVAALWCNERARKGQRRPAASLSRADSAVTPRTQASEHSWRIHMLIRAPDDAPSHSPHTVLAPSRLAKIASLREQALDDLSDTLEEPAPERKPRRAGRAAEEAGCGPRPEDAAGLLARGSSPRSVDSALQAKGAAEPGASASTSAGAAWTTSLPCGSAARAASAEASSASVRRHGPHASELNEAPPSPIQHGNLHGQGVAHDQAKARPHGHAKRTLATAAERRSAAGDGSCR
jgi:hypothetical protein